MFYVACTAERVFPQNKKLQHTDLTSLFQHMHTYVSIYDIYTYI